APHCERYVGTDFARNVLEYIHRHEDELTPRPRQLDLLHRTADDFNGLESHSFDCVILNSVVQYFPDIDYLLRMLRGAVQVVEPGGTIFLGDVLNLRLLEAFHTSVQLSQAPDDLRTTQLLQRIRRKLAQEEELFVAPTFFRELARHLPQI